MRSAAAAFLLAGTALLAQAPPAPIAIDVIVEPGGQREPLLSTAFTVTEAGHPRAVLSALLVQPSADRTPLPPVTSDEQEAAAAAAADRLIGIYVDEYHVAEDADFARARAALASFIRNRLGPRDLVLVLKPLDSLVTLRLTTDREAAARLVEGSEGRLGDYTARSAFEQQFIAGAPSRIDDARRQIALSALQALTLHLGRLSSGRKTVLVVSGGLPARQGQRRDGALPGVDLIARTANRARVAIYALRPGGRAAAGTGDADGRDTADEPIAALAGQTTGVVIDGRGSPDSGLDRVLRESGHYYMLTLSQVDQPADGAFRSVDVSVRPAGLTVRARGGYAAPRSDTEATGRRTSSLPEGLKIPRHATALIRPWFGQSLGDAGATKVDFVWERVARVPGDRSVYRAPVRVSMLVSTMDGVPVFSGTTLPSGGDGIVRGVEPAYVSFETAPGTFLVQMDVFDLAGRVLDHDVRDLVVGGFPAPLAFGTPVVFRGRTLPELRAIMSPRSVVAPAASRQFGRVEHLVVRIPVAARGEAPTAVTSTLRSKFGSVLRELPVTALEGAPRVHQVDLPLSPLPAGSYTLEFHARSAVASAIERLDFIVTP